MDLSLIIATAIQSFALKYPILMAVVSIIGILRLGMKPLFTFLHAMAEIIPGQKDNDFLAKAESSKAYKAVVFILDLFASVKLPK